MVIGREKTRKLEDIQEVRSVSNQLVTAPAVRASAFIAASVTADRVVTASATAALAAAVGGSLPEDEDQKRRRQQTAADAKDPLAHCHRRDPKP
jgi:hypothetical protein